MAVNRFSTDTDKEIELIRRIAKDAGAEDAVESTVWADGGKGGEELAEKVVEAAEKPSKFKFLYDVEQSIEEKMTIIAKKIYGADGIDISPVVRKKIRMYEENGIDKLPICMAKTHLSLSHDPKLKGRPKNFIVPIKDIRLSAGAGFLYPLLGDMRTMPGLPTTPAGTNVDIDSTGKTVGLF